jgi:hypothetical protein
VRAPTYPGALRAARGEVWSRGAASPGRVTLLQGSWVGVGVQGNRAGAPCRLPCYRVAELEV